MPVYNNERLLPNAVNSIIAQSFYDWELIIFDDGSTDNTPAVADSFADKDNRIKVIHQENQWIYRSFNNGIAASSGKYVFIVNSDDTINPDSLLKLHDAAIIDDADLVMFNLTISRCDEEQHVLDYDIYKMEKLLEEDFSYSDIECIHRYWIVWLKKKLLNHQCVYKSTIAKNEKYRTDTYAGDYLYNIQIADQIKAAAGTSYPVYNFFMYQSATMNASYGKYYGYEHELFNEIFIDYKALFEKWNVWNSNAYEFLVSARLSYFTGEIRSYSAPNCKLNIDEKIKRIMVGISDDLVYKNAKETGQLEELESRTISGLKELFAKETPSSDSEYYFIYEMIVSLFKDEKDENDRQIILNAITHEKNPLRIGTSFYQKIKWKKG